MNDKAYEELKNNIDYLTESDGHDPDCEAKLIELFRSGRLHPSSRDSTISIEVLDFLRAEGYYPYGEPLAKAVSRYLLSDNSHDHLESVFREELLSILRVCPPSEEAGRDLKVYYDNQAQANPVPGSTLSSSIFSALSRHWVCAEAINFWQVQIAQVLPDNTKALSRADSSINAYLGSLELANQLKAMDKPLARFFRLAIQHAPQQPAFERKAHHRWIRSAYRRLREHYGKWWDDSLNSLAEAVENLGVDRADEMLSEWRTRQSDTNKILPLQGGRYWGKLIPRTDQPLSLFNHPTDALESFPEYQILTTFKTNPVEETVVYA